MVGSDHLILFVPRFDVGLQIWVEGGAFNCIIMSANCRAALLHVMLKRPQRLHVCLVRKKMRIIVTSLT